MQPPPVDPATDTEPQKASRSPLAKFFKFATRLFVGNRTQTASAVFHDYEAEEAEDTQDTLQRIVFDVVNSLGYVGALVATYEQGDALPARALYVDPEIATLEQIRNWEEQISRFTKEPVSITDPSVACVYRYKPEHQDNLSIKAVEARVPVIDDELYSLFTPIAPPASRPIVKGVQRILGIEQVVAVPFFIGKDVVGNLFAVADKTITETEIDRLTAFGRQAAAAIDNERRSRQLNNIQELVYQLQAHLTDEDKLLEHIVRDIVSEFGYVSAMVATHEEDNSLPVRAFHIDERIATADDIRKIEENVSRLAGREIRIADPDIARVYGNRPEYADNLSIKAAELGQPVTSRELYDLFTPVVPKTAISIVQGIQDAFDIQQVIAVPFFIGPTLVGNLFVASRSRAFSEWEIALLNSFASQAAIGIQNARLHRKSEERRITAEIFGRMAFSSSASIHALRGHLFVVKTRLQILQMLDSLPEEDKEEFLNGLPRLFDRIATALDIVDHLHEPWHHSGDSTIDVNVALRGALSDATSRVMGAESIEVHFDMEDDLPDILTSPEMLAEAFKVILKNAAEALKDLKEPQLWLSTRLEDDQILIDIRDNGSGIRPENVSKVFEMKWSTKDQGMGFGLFWTKDFIEGIGGTISVESVLKEGTTFHITLPTTTEEEE